MKLDSNMNLQDPLFLVSRDIDGDLSADERERLNQLLAASPALQAEADQIRRVSRWVKSTARSAAQIDWKTHEQLILAEIGAEPREMSGVDALLADFAKREPVYDEGALVRGVLSRIAPAASVKQRGWRSIARIGAPLAAAAAVVLAVTATWFGPSAHVSMMPVALVQIGPSVVSDSSDASVVVRYSRVSVSVRTEDRPESIGYMTLGSSPVSGADESPL